MIEGMKKELRALLFVLLFLSLGVLLLWAANHWVNNDPITTMGDAVLVSLLLMPILIYAIISGSLTELKGPGGLGATFNSVAATSVSETTAHDRLSFDEDSQILVNEGADALKRKIRNRDETRPIMITVTFGERCYTLKILREYVEILSRSRSSKLVVFLDHDGRFLAYMPSWAAKNILNAQGSGEEFVKMINEGNHELFSYPGIVRKTISTRSTNAEALREMTDKNVDALVVTDKNNQLKGIAEREQVLSRMMLALAE